MDDGTTDPGRQRAAAADPWAPPPPGVAPAAVADPALLALHPLAPGSAPGWYRTTVGTDLRYWDGLAWTARTAPDETPKATYAQRFLRRFWLVLLVVSVVYGLYAVLGIARPGLLGTRIDRSPAYLVGSAIGAVLGFVLVALVITALVSAVPGRQKVDPVTGAPRASRLRVWSALAAAACAVLLGVAFVRSEPVPVQTIATTKDGCHAFMDTMETVTRENATDSRLKASMQRLHDEALSHDPQLAADVAPLITSPTKDASEGATRSILGRCLDNGDITRDEIQTWVDTLRTDLANLGG